MLGVSKCPCRDCSKRFPSCHSSCEDYISWRKELDDRNELVREEKKQRSFLYSYSGRK